jgi:hypothetical protein
MPPHLSRAAVPACAALLAACPSSALADTPGDAAAFRDSVGVNTHVAYIDTQYGRWTTVLDKLQALGVKHLRDGAYGNPAWRDWNKRYNANVQAAAARGMRFTFLMGRPGHDGGTIDQLVTAAAGPLAGAIEAFEGPNEYDLSGNPTWASTLRSYQSELYTKLKANPATLGFPVLAPSLVYPASRTSLGNLEHAADQGNMHPYTGGETPTALRITSDMALARKVTGSKPLIATEEGFHNAMAANATQAPVPESVAAVYTVRALLENFRAGVGRTYLYELLDLRPDAARTNSEHNWGLLRNDFSEKPAYTALKNLMAMIGTPAPLQAGQDLPVTVTGDTAGVNRLLLQRADGTYLLALWQDASLWDTKARRTLTVPEKSIRVDLGGATIAAVHRPVQSAATTQLALVGGPTDLTLPADPVILEFSRPTPPVVPASAPAAPAVAAAVEAETMTLPRSGAVRSDGAASGGRVLGIWSNVRASTSVTTTGTAVKLTVTARGAACQGAPTMRAYVDGVQVGVWSVRATALADHTASVSVPAGARRVSVGFSNDHRTATCDRNLFVDKVVMRRG